MADFTKEMLSEKIARGEALERADLRNLDLRGVALAGANLRRVDLRGANLEKCDLRKANLAAADLRDWWQAHHGSYDGGGRYREGRPLAAGDSGANTPLALWRDEAWEEALAAPERALRETRRWAALSQDASSGKD